jgi:WD40 repeat protein
MPATADWVMARALAKRPEQRYASCREFTDALRETFGLPPYGSGAIATFPGAPATTADLHTPHGTTQAVVAGQGARSVSRRPLVIALAGAVLVAAVAIPWWLASGPGSTVAQTTGAQTTGANTAAAKSPAATQQPTTLAVPSATLTAPAGSHAVESAAFKPGTATLAVGMFNGDVDLRDTATKKMIKILPDPAGGTDGTALVAFGPGGTTMAAGDGGDVYLWDTGGRAPVLTATLPTPADASGQSVTSVAFGNDGALAVGYSEGDVYLWDTATKQTTAALTGPADASGVTLVAFGQGGILAVGYSGGDVYLWNTAANKNTATLTGPPGLAGTDGVISVAFAPGGATMAVSYDNGDVYLWDIASKQTFATITPPADSQTNGVVAFGPGGMLAIGYDSGDVRLWNTATQKVTDTLNGHGDGTGAVSAMTFGPGGTLAVGAANGDVDLWRIKS